MKRSTVLKVIIFFLVLVMSLSMFSACAETPELEPKETEKKTETETPVANEPEETPEPKSTTPLVVGIQDMSEKFSPFFADSGYDTEVQDHTHVTLLTTDRTGGIVYNAADGEVIPYNGVDYTYYGPANVEVNYDEAADKTTYLWTLRDDIKFSDGEALDADDLIFTLYVFLDPSYVGSNTLYSVPIVGMNNYRTQTSDEVFEKYAAWFDSINTAGKDHEWAETDSWAKELQVVYWAMNEDVWKADIQAIVDYCVANYGAYMEQYAGVLPEDLEDGKEMVEQKAVAAGMGLWGFGAYDAEANTLTGAATGTVWSYNDGQYPTLEEFYNEAYVAYEGDIVAYAEAESPGDNAANKLKDSFIKAEGPKDPSLGEGGIPNITGIKKLNQYQVEITVNGFDASAIYRMDVQITPLHYYGDEAQYDYDNNKFGFPFGDLSIVEEKTTMPMGAGAYRFIKFENRVVYFEANEHYYLGEPKTYYMQYKEGDDADFIPGVGTGTIDIGNPSFGNDQVDEIMSYNSNGEIVGDTIHTSTVNNLGYGYIGLNAETMKVGDDPSSEESKNLRKGFTTLLAAYRSLSIDSYYGERASIINYPISNTSWAAPQPSDDGYKIAFSTGVDGADLYTSEMNAEARHEIALKAAIDYFVNAGYTYDEASGKLTAAPDGAKLEYECIVPGDGAGDHPSFLLVTKVKEALETIGMTLILNDPVDSNVLWDKLDAGTQEMWCAAWEATIDPDMYQIYHSSNIVGLPGSSESNHYHIQDSELDELILEARTSPDQSFRKATYKACLDIIIDWAVEVPIYQRQNCIIFSPERINIDTLTPDITTFFEWFQDIEKLEMNPT